MGRLTEAVFSESCCDGGSALGDQSCQPCGCDKGAGWVCDVHRYPDIAPLKRPFVQEVEEEAYRLDKLLIKSHQQTLIQEGRGTLPTTPAERKDLPITSGVLDYFPLAIAEVARVSKIGNDQHNPGQPLHWDRSKSTDEADALVRHLMERGKFDTDGARHSAKMAWRALALLQKEIENEGANRL